MRLIEYLMRTLCNVKDDILTIDHCDPCYLVTGSYDGTIIVWNEETEQIITTLKKPRRPNRYTVNEKKIIDTYVVYKLKSV